MTVIITKELEPFWDAERVFKEGGENAVIDLVQEDTAAFLDGADWAVTE